MTPAELRACIEQTHDVVFEQVGPLLAQLWEAASAIGGVEDETLHAEIKTALRELHGLPLLPRARRGEP